MSDYIVSARKYRPEKFETLIGQDNIARTLKNSILRGQLAHAYLFCGPRGVGKTTTARIFAKMINCSNPSADMEPCGECESCVSFAEGRSYCIHELDAASNNGIDDIKSLIDQVRIPPQIGKYSVYIIDEVHMLSQAAFNAFLKTLEEPPAHAIFILATTEKHKILPTILSRCQTYDFNRISIENIVLNLRMIATREGIEIDDESLHIIAGKADGAMRDALTIFDQTVAFCGTNVRYEEVMKNLNVLSHEHSFALVDNFLSGDYGSALLRFDEVLSKGFNALHFISALSSHIRNLIVSKSAGLESLLELPQSLKERYLEQASRCSVKFLYDCLSVTTQCEAQYKASINPRLHIEFTLMRLSFLMNQPQGAAIQQERVPQVNAAAQTPAREVPQAAPPVNAPQPIQPALSQSPAESPAAGTPLSETQALPRRRRQATAVLSVKNIVAAEEQAVGAESATQPEDKGDAPGEEQIRQGWGMLAKAFEEKQPRLANAIASSRLNCETLQDGVKVTFLVSNEAQMKWIQSHILSNLEGMLQKAVGYRGLSLEVGVIPAEEKAAVPYTPQEKLGAIVQEHPEVKELISDLDAVIR